MRFLLLPRAGSLRQHFHKPATTEDSLIKGGYFFDRHAIGLAALKSAPDEIFAMPCSNSIGDELPIATHSACPGTAKTCQYLVCLLTFHGPFTE